LHPRLVSVERFPAWAEKNLKEGDIVIWETTTNIWETYNIVAPLVSRVLVENAAEVGEIAGARAKTDRKDIERLLRLLFGGIVPEVWVPAAHVRELRSFISYRNRLNSLLHKHNLIILKAVFWIRLGGMLKARSVHWRSCKPARSCLCWQRSIGRRQPWMKSWAGKAQIGSGRNRRCEKRGTAALF